MQGEPSAKIAIKDDKTKPIINGREKVNIPRNLFFAASKNPAKESKIDERPIMRQYLRMDVLIYIRQNWQVFDVR